MAECFLKKSMTIIMCDYLTVEGESVRFSSVMMKSHISEEFTK